MRNLVAYPITKSEILDCLDQFAREIDPAKTHIVGDMRPVLLEEAKKIILASAYIVGE